MEPKHSQRRFRKKEDVDLLVTTLEATADSKELCGVKGFQVCYSQNKQNRFQWLWVGLSVVLITLCAQKTGN